MLPTLTTGTLDQLERSQQVDFHHQIKTRIDVLRLTDIHLIEAIETFNQTEATDIRRLIEVIDTHHPTEIIGIRQLTEAIDTHRQIEVIDTHRSEVTTTNKEASNQEKEEVLTKVVVLKG